MAPQMTRINLDFSVSDAKKITKIATEKQKNTHISTYTHPHTHNSTA